MRSDAPRLNEHELWCGTAPATPVQKRYSAPAPQYDDRRYDGSDSDACKKTKENPLSELFDF